MEYLQATAPTPTAGGVAVEKRYGFSANKYTTAYLQTTTPTPTVGRAPPVKWYGFGAKNGAMAYLQDTAPAPTVGGSDLEKHHGFGANNGTNTNSVLVPFPYPTYSGFGTKYLTNQLTTNPKYSPPPPLDFESELQAKNRNTNKTINFVNPILYSTPEYDLLHLTDLRLPLQLTDNNFQVNMYNPNNNLIGIPNNNITYITSLPHYHKQSPGTPPYTHYYKYPPLPYSVPSDIT